ncbi:MAG: hypothetical protein KDC57_18075 [Saprospiraceae bacterium]|nr:hypothetical protein [Saprospiraceae bacterium]
MEEIRRRYLRLLQPSAALINDVSRLSGDFMILGAGGKMGPALARLARQAVLAAGTSSRVMAASRFSEPGVAEGLQEDGIETFHMDLLDERQLFELPEADYILYLAGMKFGTTGNEPMTWAMNTYLPGRVAEKYRRSRLVAFSTGNVYPFSSVHSGGATESTIPEPVGEYAQSCLGRERIFQYASQHFGTHVLLYRLNYANDVRYGVLLEIARAVWEGRPLDLRMGYVNVIWQGDANEMAIRCLHHCDSPARILNVTGPETLSVRTLAENFGYLLNRNPVFVNQEESTALLSNASECKLLFGPPRVSVQTMQELIAAWLIEGGETLAKPTHFQEREGRF